MKRLLSTLASSLIVIALPASLRADDTARAPLLVGVDANYSLDMEKTGPLWKWDGRQTDLFQGMAQQGVTEFRVRLWLKDEGPHGKTYATEVVKRALHGGLNPYLVLFLSDDWSDMMKQPVPAVWKDLSFEERAAAIKAYSRDIVMHFRKQGVSNHLYEIGNEIDYGICGEYPGKSTKKNAETLSQRLWPRSAQLIAASQAGVREADPDAKFMLHIAHWWDAEFCIAFFRHMREHGVQIDYAGLSYFPSSNIGGSLELAEFGATVSRLSAAIDRPVIVPETAYPSTRDFTGQFSRWKYEVPGYPLTPEGQRRWVADFLAFCQRQPQIHAVYYWSPEWCGEGMWKAFALFEPDGQAKPAWSAFSREARERAVVRESVYVEVVSNRVFTVPVQEAKEKMVALVAQLRERTGGVTIEHIALLTNTHLQVGAYLVDLKASLQENLSLRLAEATGGIALSAETPPVLHDDAKALAAAMDPAKERLVLFLRQEPTPATDQLVAFFAQKGIRVDVHPKADDVPLKFGLCGRFGKPHGTQ